jgi:hypothetical protein
MPPHKWLHDRINRNFSMHCRRLQNWTFCTRDRKSPIISSKLAQIRPQPLIGSNSDSEVESSSRGKPGRRFEGSDSDQGRSPTTGLSIHPSLHWFRPPATCVKRPDFAGRRPGLGPLQRIQIRPEQRSNSTTRRPKHRFHHKSCDEQRDYTTNNTHERTKFLF